MARESHDREDLLRDATAYVSRVQLKVVCGQRSCEVFIGFHKTGATSFYFDQDPVYHFNRSGELRRAFVGGRLLKSEAGRLVSMSRQRTGSESALVRHEFSSAEQAEFCHSANTQLGELLNSLRESQYEIEGVVPFDESDVIVERVKNCLESQGEIVVADSPRVTA